MAIAHLEQKFLAFLYLQLVLPAIAYGLGLLTLSESQFKRLKRIQNEGMRIVLGCTRDTPILTMRYMLGLLLIKSRHSLSQAKAYMRVTSDKRHPLHKNIADIKGRRIKRGMSWMAQALRTIEQVAKVETITRGEEWINIGKCMTTYQRVIITRGRECREWGNGKADLEIKQLIEDNARDDDAIV
jgi:hypothetical protein